MTKKQMLQDIYSLSPMQEGMLFHYENNRNTTAYIEQFDFTIEGDLEQDILTLSFNDLVSKYDVFRTIFSYKKISKARQVVLKDRKVTIQTEDLLNVKADSQGGKIEQIKNEDRAKGFDLTKDVLIRLTLIKTGEQSSHLICTFHHIILDGWSLGAVFNDLFSFYAMRKKNPSSIESELLIDNHPFKGFVKWLDKQDLNLPKKHWTSYLEGYEEKSSLLEMKEGGERARKEIAVKIDAQLTSKIKTVSKQLKNHTISHLFQTAWAVLLQKYTNKDDVAFGSIVSGRSSEINGIEQMVGMFINIQPVRFTYQESDTFLDMLEKMTSNVEAKKYEYYPLATIQSNHKLQNNLIDHLIAFENYPITEQMKGADTKDQLGFLVSDVEVYEETNYPLNIIIMPGDEMLIKVIYQNDSYSEKYLNEVFEFYQSILEKIVENPSIKIVDLWQLNKELTNQLVEQNTTTTYYPREKNVVQLFDEQVSSRRNELAISDENVQLTYEELDGLSNQMACVLQDKGLVKGDRIALIADRSHQSIVAILAILKAGGVYVPIHPSYPDNRIEYMLKDTECKLLLCKSEFRANELPVERLNVDTVDLTREPSTSITQEIDPQEVAYIMYTSGSTGEPKGVLIKHQNIVRLVKNNTYVSLNEDTKVLLTGSIAFDASTFEIWGALLNGGALCLLPERKILDVQILKKTIDSLEINTMWFTSAYFNQLVEDDLTIFENLKNLLVGGDRLSPKHISKFIATYPQINVINGYGPTENTTFSTTFKIEKEYTNGIPIGKPIANSTAFIIGIGGEIQPVGAIGELHVGGDGLALGYLNNKTSTEEKFIEHPAYGRLYKTGDLAKWLPDGNIEFIGRDDNQIKIRGYRIEIAEIEKCIDEIDEIDEACVLVLDINNEKTLGLYYTSSRSEEQKIRSFLSKNLPSYMVPSFFMKLDKFPLNQNGKINRSELPIPTFEIGNNSPEAYSEKEKQIAEVWQKVLNLPSLPHTNVSFFEIGGQSIKAMSLVSEFRKVFEVEVALATIFEHGTIAEQAQHLEQLAGKVMFPKIEKVSVSESYELSCAQKRIFALSEFENDSVIYNMPGVYELEGSLDIDKLETAFQYIIKRHETLRTNFKLDEGKPFQYIHDNIDWAIERGQVHEWNNEYLKNAIDGFIQPFDLGTGPLLRVKIISQEEQKHLFMFDMHHIISDGVSMDKLMEELWSFYQKEESTPLPIQYKDFAHWQNELLSSDLMKEQKEYWLNVLSDQTPVLELPLDFPRPIQQSFEGSNVQFSLGEDLTNQLKQTAKELNVTMQMLLYSAYHLLLSKYSGQDDLLIGVPVAGRNEADTADLIGMFVNTLVMRNQSSPNLTLAAFIAHVKNNAIAAYQNQDYQFDKLVDELNLPRVVNRNPLFDTMFILQNREAFQHQTDAMKLTPYPINLGIAKFDIMFQGWEEHNKISFDIEYGTALFKKETIEQMGAHYRFILEQIATSTDAKLKDVSLLRFEEIEELKSRDNNTSRPYPKNQSIDQLFEKQVKERPDNIALVMGNESMTYKELGEKTDQLATTLLQNGIKEEMVVGVMLERSIETIISLLAIVKAGAVYLPIDPEYPATRKEFMLEDSKVQLLITDTSLDKEHSYGGKVLHIDDKEVYAPFVNLESFKETAHRLAYIIYTSGSTGKPKGVMIEHINVTRLVMNNEFLTITPKDTILQTGAPVFDATTFEIWGALLNGATLCLVDDTILLDPELLSKKIETSKVSIMWMTAPLFNQMIDQKVDLFNQLNHLIVGGDALSPEHIRLARENSPQLKIINGYGPTENTTFSTTFLIEEDYKTSIPIGKPISNSTAYVFNENRELIPSGIIGELYVGGDGVARGYLNRPKLTEESFIPNPYKLEERLYRTGDLVKRLKNRNLEFIGRKDSQAKIRGYRIELGEIERVLTEAPSIQEAVVLVKGTVDKKMVAYIGAANYEDLTISEVREYLLKHLPDYMIPSNFMFLESLPLTKNGKVDKRALPEPKIESAEYEAPTNEIETILVGIWKETLVFDQESELGINDNFFEIGGDSIKAIKITSDLQKFGYKINMKDLFQYQTIKELSNYVQLTSGSKVDQGKVFGEVSLAPIQKWYFQEQYNHQPDFTQKIILETVEKIDLSIFQTAMEKVLEQHDILRSTFVLVEEDKWEQKISESTYFDEFIMLETHTIEEEGKDKHILQLVKQAEAQVLLTNKMIRVLLVNTPQETHLVFIVHHLLIDGVSWRILIEDFTQAYINCMEETEVNFPDKTLSYLHWTEKLYDYSKSNKLALETSFWINQEQQKVIPLEKENILGTGGRKKLKTSLNPSLSKDLTRSIHKAFNTNVNDVLLTALKGSICDWTGSDNMLVAMESHGRTSFDEDIDVVRTIGWFTSMYPVLFTHEKGGTVEEQLKSTKKTLRSIPNDGIGYGVLKYIKNLDKVGSLQPQISFNYLGQMDMPVDKNNEQYFTMSQLSMQEEETSNADFVTDIDVVGYLKDGQIELIISYDGNQFNESTIQNILNNCIVNLKGLVNACKQKNEAIEREGIDQEAKNVSIEVIKEVSAAQDAYDNNLKEQEETLYYPLTAIQVGNLSTEFNQSLVTIPFVKAFNIKIFEQAFYQMIKDQGLLRSVLVKEDMRYFWREYNVPENVEIPYIDLSDNDATLTNQIIKTIIEEKFKINFIERGSFMYNVVLIKRDENDYLLTFVLDHSIVDVMSINIIKNTLTMYYTQLEKGEEVEKKEINSYYKYANQINKLPEMSFENLLDMFSLKEIKKERDHFEDVLDKRDTGEIQSLIKYEIETGVQLDETKAWDISFALYCKTLTEYFQVKKVPLTMFSFGRRYGDNTYFDTIGEFIDLMPILVDLDNMPLEQVVESTKDKLKMSIDHEVNFINLAQIGPYIGGEWAETPAYFAPRLKDKILLASVFNFQGKFIEEELEEAYDFAVAANKKDDQMQKTYCSLAFEVQYTDEKLYFSILSRVSEDIDVFKRILDKQAPIVFNEILGEVEV